MQTAIVIPTYNERENLDDLIKRVFAQDLPDLGIIFVDDNSADGTREFIEKLIQRHPVTLISRPKKLGLGSAYVTGFQRALTTGAEFILEMDADLSHAPEDLPQILKAAKEGADVVIGSRKIPGGRIVGWNLWRRITSDGAMFFARLVLNLKTRDVTAGFRCYRRLALEKIDFNRINSSGYAFQEEMIFRMERMGCKIQEIPVTFVDRKFGQSKLSWREAAEFFKVMFKLKFCGKKAP